VTRSGLALQQPAAELRADREVVLAAMAKSGTVLQHSAAELRADREVVLAAVAQNGLALRYGEGEDASSSTRLVIGGSPHELATRACRIVSTPL
jgi:hypothetical protein